MRGHFGMFFSNSNVGYLSLENIHYDFFKDYTKNDQDLLDGLYNADSFDVESLFSLEQSGVTR